MASLVVLGTPAIGNGCNKVYKPAPRPAKHIVTRAYPICFFNKKPEVEELNTMVDKFGSFIRPYMPGGLFQIGISPDSRWISLKGAQAGHDALKKVWPRLGCYGDYIKGDEYKMYRLCVLYLEAFMAQNKYSFGGAESDGDGISGQLFCGGK